MKARIPKAYRDMTPKQQEQLREYVIDLATEAARKQEENDCRAILDAYMKMVCCVLHDAFGFGEKRLNYFIGCHKRLFDRQNRLVEKGEQQAYLNRRMAEIFRKDGFPVEFMKSLIGEIEIVEVPQKEEDEA